VEAALGERVQYRPEVDGARHAGAAAARLVRAEMTRVLAVLRDRAFDSRVHARHRLAIEHVADGRRIDRLAERDRLFDRLEKGRLARVKSLDEKLYAASLARARGLAEDAHRAVEGLSRARPREEIPLLRRAENHDLPTDVRAEIGERGDVA